ncbi:glycine cleavage T C-terminal barrel domain-containing protein [Algihabitans albus]|uniref:glycine cleavage T C-terminal barrel domain-containing protein n=1 Tax=Algihabitans albus TaxID=2164067 RepID=UPI000E5D0FF1|nr:glycine cleavage T C-terminal barrel domain-containing protein [Algihabitans albus]
MAQTTARMPTGVDQSDRKVPINLRQSGPTPVEMLISTRVRKSPYWHLSMEAGCWRATVYNRMYHPRGYVRPEDGGAMVEYDALVNHVTMWNVAVERQIQVIGPDAEAFVNYVITRDAKRIKPMHGKYVILCNDQGGILNDPVLLRLSETEFWFSLSDSDLMFWLQGVNVGRKFDVEINEIDVSPVQIQGPKSEALLADLVGEAIKEVPVYGLLEAKVGGRDVVISQSGFSGEKGYEIYLRDATLYAEDMWYAVLEAGKAHNLMVIAPAHHRRIAAGILSWGQDLDAETLPFQCNLGYQVPRLKTADYIGKAKLEEVRAELEAGNPPYKQTLIGLRLGGKPIEDYANDFWLISGEGGGEALGYVTSPWYSPELGSNIAMGYVPLAQATLGTRLKVHLPDLYAESPGQAVEAEVVEMPFRPSVNPNAREIAKAEGRDAAF